MMRRRGKRGKHTSPRRPLSASKEEWERWDSAASKLWPYTFAEWARTILNKAAEIDLRLAGARTARISARTSTRRRLGK